MTRPAPSINGAAAPAGAPSVLRRLMRRAVDVVLPPQCLRCDVMVDAPGSLCAACWEKIAFVEAPLCAACGLPFEFDAGDGALCALCSRARPAFERARAAMVYDDASRDLVLAFKHGDRTDAAPAYGRWMARAGADLIAAADLAAPVPLHWTRLFRRRYNQAALLAIAIGGSAGVDVACDLLVRRRRTPSLGTLGAARRRQVVAGAFAVDGKRRSAIQARRVLLVDDVLTTGATAEACARTLLDAGAAAVDVLTLARVVRALEAGR